MPSHETCAGYKDFPIGAIGHTAAANEVVSTMKNLGYDDIRICNALQAVQESVSEYSLSDGHYFSMK